jgi:hypothetical protein
MSFDHTVNLSYGMEKRNETTARYALGTRGELPDGRVFYYAQAGAALGAGHLCVSRAPVGNHDSDLAVSTAAGLGANSIEVTLGATSLGTDEYKDGYIYVNDVDGEGHMYRISSHAAAAASTQAAMALADDDVIVEALTTSSQAGLYANPFKDVVEVALDVDREIAGVAVTEVANAEFCWLQTFGLCAVFISTGTSGHVPIVGRGLQPMISTSDITGSVEKTSTALDNAWHGAQHIGVLVNVAAATTETGLASLTIRQ